MDQLDWWRTHSEQFPLLSLLVRIVFCVPVASSKSERVYCAAGRYCTSSRSSLAPEKVENLVTMHENLHLLKAMGKRK